MKDTVLTAIKCFLSVILLDVMCLFIYGSFVTVALSVGETVITGYQITTYDEDGNALESVYCEPEEKEDKVAALESEKADYAVQDIKVLSDSTSDFVEVLTAVCSLLILFGMIYTTTWARGDKDCNLSTFGGASEDRHKGLKIGLIAVVPIIAAYLYFWIDKFAEYELYGLTAVKAVNYYMFPIVNSITGSAATANDVSVVSALLLLSTFIFVPLVSVFGYYCGSHGISIKEKLLYVKKEKK